MFLPLNIGESSAGKSSFLNLLLGEQLLPSAVLSSTSTICELKYCTERKLVVHYQGENPETVPLYQSDESSYMEQISSYVHIKSEREKGSPIKMVEIFWPHELLKVYLLISFYLKGHEVTLRKLSLSYLKELLK